MRGLQLMNRRRKKGRSARLEMNACHREQFRRIDYAKLALRSDNKRSIERPARSDVIAVVNSQAILDEIDDKLRTTVGQSPFSRMWLRRTLKEVEDVNEGRQSRRWCAVMQCHLFI